MRPGFMSSVLPQQTIGELIGAAQAYGYEGLEFRPEWGQRHGVELGVRPAWLRSAAAMLREEGIAPSCIATGCRFNIADLDTQSANRVKLRQYIALAAELGAPLVRTFSDPLPEGDAAARDQVIAMAAASYQAVDEWAGQHGVTVLVETHTNMLAQHARTILDRAQCEHLGVLWHISHHLVRGQSVDEAYGRLRGAVRHLHLAAQPEEHGATLDDNQRMLSLLAADGFTGFASVEIINPPNPQQVLAHHMSQFRQLVATL